MKTIRRAIVVTGLVLGAALAWGESPLAVELNIKRQPIADALNQWAQATGFQLIFPEETATSALVSPEVRGRYEPEAALARILENSGLKFQFLNERTVAITEAEKPTAELREVGGVRLTQAQASPQSDATNAQGTAKIQDPAANKEGPAANKVEEIVVTAQRREERLQDVPISISILAGNDLDKFTGVSVNEALTRVPGFVINQGSLQADGTVLNVRGVSAAGPIHGGSSTIAYYVDTVPFGFVRSAFVPDPNAYDLQRVEALRGPQGTLYGANALNGVVRVLTNDADLNDFELKTRASFSTIDEGGDGYRGDLAANIPLIADKLGARLVLGYLEEGGWIDRRNQSDANDGHQNNARLKLNTQPTENLSIGASAWLSRSRYDSSRMSAEGYQYDGVMDQPQSVDFDAFGLKIDYEFSGFSISSMTSYIDYQSDNWLDATPLDDAFGFPTPVFEGTSFFTGANSKVVTEEVLLTSTREGAWRWSLGGYYRDSKDLNHLEGIFVSAPVLYNDFSESSAIFGELTRVLVDGKLELTAGLRYFKDRVQLKELLPHSGVEGDSLVSYDATFDDVSPRVILTWHPSPNSTVYGSYAEGFRSGISPSPPVVKAVPEFPPAEPDSLRNYEVGAKGTTLNGRLSYDAALYYIDWKGVQQVVAVTIGPGVFNAFVNGESASGLGVDLGLSSRLTDRWQLSGSFSWNDLGFDNTMLVPGTEIVVFGEGDRLGMSSEFTASAALDYSFPFGGRGLESGFSLGANWHSRQATRSINSGPTTQEGEDVLFARAEIFVGDPDRWRALLFVDNLSNEQSLLMPGGIFASWSMYARPRTMGLQLEYAWGRQ